MEKKVFWTMFLISFCSPNGYLMIDFKGLRDIQGVKTQIGLKMGWTLGTPSGLESFLEKVYLTDFLPTMGCTDDPQNPKMRQTGRWGPKSGSKGAFGPSIWHHHDIDLHLGWVVVVKLVGKPSGKLQSTQSNQAEEGLFR